MLLHGYRAGAGSAAAVRSGKRLVQVQVHHVDAEIAGTRNARQRVHVGAVHIQQRALGVQDVRDLGDVFLEHAEGVGIGDHDPGDIFVHCARQGFGVHHAARVGRDIFDCVAGHVRGSRIGAVGRIRNQKLLARVALGGEGSVNQQDAGELAMRAGGGLQRHRVHAGDFEQAALQLSA